MGRLVTLNNATEVSETIAQAVMLAEQKNFSKALLLLQEAQEKSPADVRMAPHVERIRYLEARSNDTSAQRETREGLDLINRMKTEIERNPLYSPSMFWSHICEYHIGLIKMYGMEQFKRTVSHHYQNWLMISFDDPQVRRLLETWSSHFHAEPLLTNIETPSHVGFTLGDKLDAPEYPLASREYREVYRLAVSLLWEYVLVSDNVSVLATLEESEVGNPIRIRRQGRLISSDLAHSVRERNMLLKSCGLVGSEALVVGELGAGHGRIAEVYGRTTNYRYMIFDIPPALYVAQWYVKKIFPDDKIFEFRHFDSFAEISEELKNCRFAFFTANQIELMPDNCFDLFYNMNSLMEMRYEQIDNFLSHISRTTKTAFFSRQYKEWKNVADNITVTERHFQIGQSWGIVLSETDDIHPQFFNHIWRKTKTLAERDQLRAERGAALVDRDAAAAHRDHVAAELAAVKADRDQALAARDAAMAETANKNDALCRIQESIVWRLASPLWRLETRGERKRRRALK